MRLTRRATFRRPLLVALAGLLAWVLACALAWLPAPFSSALAQSDTASVPQFWDPQRRLERPDTSALRSLRIITDDEYPPFGFTTAEGQLAGFNVDLARAICDELKVSCTIQARRFDTIFDTLDKNEADAAIASIAITPRTLARADFTQPYYRTPARFVTRSGTTLDDPRPETMAGKVIGVQERTAHAAYLQKFFGAAEIKSYPSALALRSALKLGEVPVIFGDGVSLALWLNGSDAAGCCAFRGGPFLESGFFGEGVGIAVKRDNAPMRRIFDFALARLAQRGVYAELYLKYFPIGFF